MFLRLQKVQNMCTVHHLTQLHQMSKTTKNYKACLDPCKPSIKGKKKSRKVIKVQEQNPHLVMRLSLLELTTAPWPLKRHLCEGNLPKEGSVYLGGAKSQRWGETFLLKGLAKRHWDAVSGSLPPSVLEPLAAFSLSQPFKAPSPLTCSLKHLVWSETADFSRKFLSGFTVLVVLWFL